MPSILSNFEDNFKRPTHTELLNRDFVKVPWGSPDGRYKNGKLKWNKEKMCYELTISESIYLGQLVYFPEGFNSMVLPNGRYILKEPENKGYLSIDSADNWHKVVEINNLGDLDLCIEVLKKELKKKARKLY